jgi:L-2-hydroxyglutarate oxidase
VGFAGFRKLAARHWRMGLMEVRRSLDSHLFVDSLRRLVPEVRDEDVVRGGAGVRAQAINSEGNLVDDFSFIEMPRALHVINAPSPAATASLAIGEHIMRRASDLFGWN